PVVHWYGFDEIHRPHCAQHQDEVLRQQMCSACIAEQRPVWTHAVLPVDEDRARARATECLDHLRCELQAVGEEHDRGRVVSTPRGSLDASSDALAYLDGHWNRLTSWSFGAWAELFSRPGLDHVSTPWAQLERVAELASRLCDPVPALEALRDSNVDLRSA